MDNWLFWLVAVGVYLGLNFFLFPKLGIKG